MHNHNYIEEWYLSRRPVTKTIMPSVPAVCYRSARIQAQFKEAFTHSVVQIIAQAGYGKTIAVADYLFQQQRRTAWLSLSKQDSNIFDFWASVIYSIHRVVPDIGQLESEILISSDMDTEKLLNCLINDISVFAPDLIIALDNYHIIMDEDIHKSLIYLMEYLPPESRLVIVSRADFPLSLYSLKGKGRLSVLDAGNLRLSREETFDFFRVVSKIELEENTLRDVDIRIEGWITGLKMISLSCTNAHEVERFVQNGIQSEQDMLDYMVGEVIDGQDYDTAEFLLKTSLFHKFSSAMCNYVFETDDSREMIDNLLSGELFIQRDDDYGEWYRYHPLFRDALRNQIKSRLNGTIPALYLRACEWNEQQNILDDALSYAIEAEAFDKANDILNRLVMVILGQDNYEQFWKWLNRLPSKLVNSNLWANVGCAVSCEMRRMPVAQTEFIQKALELYKKKGQDILNDYPDGDNILTSITVLQILDAYHKGETEQAIAIADERLSTMAKSDIQGRCSILCLKGFSEWCAGELMESYHSCREAAMLGVMANWKYSVCLNLSAAANALLEMGKIQEAENVCHEILTIKGINGEYISSACYARLILAKIYWLKNDLEEANRQLIEAEKMGDVNKEPVVAFISKMAMATIKMAKSQERAAMNTALRARLSFDSTITDSMLSEIMYSYLLLISGNPDEAWIHTAVFNKLDLIDWNSKDVHSEVMKVYSFRSDVRNVCVEDPLVCICRVKLARRDFDHLEDIIKVIFQETKSRGYKIIHLNAKILFARFLELSGKEDEAVACIQEALDISEPHGLIRPYTDVGGELRKLLKVARNKGRHIEHIGDILGAFGDIEKGSTKMPVTRDFTEPLTYREMQILQMICQGKSNKEISGTLFLSLSTVKNHTHNIYCKLGVSNRSQAMVRAAELNILK